MPALAVLYAVCQLSVQ